MIRDIDLREYDEGGHYDYEDPNDWKPVEIRDKSKKSYFFHWLVFACVCFLGLCFYFGRVYGG